MRRRKRRTGAEWHTVFKTVAFVRSAILPTGSVQVASTVADVFGASHRSQPLGDVSRRSRVRAMLDLTVTLITALEPLSTSGPTVPRALSVR
jgi:hypothetical protein